MRCYHSRHDWRYYNHYLMKSYTLDLEINTDAFRYKASQWIEYPVVIEEDDSFSYTEIYTIIDTGPLTYSN